MRKIPFVIMAMLAMAACEKHDPILPGVRQAIFAQNNLNILNIPVKDLPENITEQTTTECPYTQTSSNTILKGDVKIFSGFPTANSVECQQKPVCSGKYIYAGLTTGEVVKIEPETRNIVWVADVYKPSTMTGGSSVADIVAPIFVGKEYVYAAGLGDAFCKIGTDSATKKWCVEIGSSHKFIVLKNVSYIVGTDNNLYAVRDSDGAIYWSAPVNENVAPIYENKTIRVGNQVFDAGTGTSL